MMKFVVFALLVSAAAASTLPLISSQRAIIPHYSPYGYGHGKGISTRYFDKVESLGYGVGPKFLVNPYGRYGYNGIGYAGLGYAGLGYDGLGYAGLGYAGLGYGKHRYL